MRTYADNLRLFLGWSVCQVFLGYARGKRPVVHGNNEHTRFDVPGSFTLYSIQHTLCRP